MELNRTSKWLYILLGLWISFILSLGAWWTHLYIKFSDFTVYSSNPEEFYRVTRMLKWEGITVFIGLLALSILILYIFFRDQRKTSSIRSFFSTMTHEMKTPLASIKLQTQALTDLLKDLNPEHYKKIENFAKKLIEDGNKLESEMDEILQLARLESGGHLDLETLNADKMISNIISTYPELEFELIKSKNNLILSNSYAFKLIFRNLIENTKKHRNNNNKIKIIITNDNDKIQIRYHDQGEHFLGEISKLGQLFYRYNSDKGTGLGLYLINKLMNHMQGQFEIDQNKNLTFDLIFKRGLDV